MERFRPLPELADYLYVCLKSTGLDVDDIEVEPHTEYGFLVRVHPFPVIHVSPDKVEGMTEEWVGEARMLLVYSPETDYSKVGAK